MQETEQDHLKVGAESSESARSTVVVPSFLEDVATLLTARVEECRMLWWLGEKSARALFQRLPKSLCSNCTTPCIRIFNHKIQGDFYQERRSALVCVASLFNNIQDDCGARGSSPPSCDRLSSEPLGSLKGCLTFFKRALNANLTLCVYQENHSPIIYGPCKPVHSYDHVCH